MYNVFENIRYEQNLSGRYWTSFDRNPLLSSIIEFIQLNGSILYLYSLYTIYYVEEPFFFQYNVHSRKRDSLSSTGVQSDSAWGEKPCDLHPQTSFEKFQLMVRVLTQH